MRPRPAAGAFDGTCVASQRGRASPRDLEGTEVGPQRSRGGKEKSIRGAPAGFKILGASSGTRPCLPPPRDPRSPPLGRRCRKPTRALLPAAEKIMDLQKRRVQVVLFVAGLLLLSMTAEKFRELVGEEAASKSGKFTFLNCFDMGSGSLACSAKEGVKLYVYTIRSSHVEKVRRQAIEVALTEAVSGGLNPSAAAKQAEKAGAKAAKLASRQAKRILGPIISSGWDFFEAVYFGGTMTEGFLRGAGTLAGTYVGGFLGEERLGKVGYLMGSHLGSWVGGRIGLMVYDVVNGVSYLVQFVQAGESTETSLDDSSYRSEERSFETRTEDGQVGYRGTETYANYGQDAEPEATSESAEASDGWGFL